MQIILKTSRRGRIHAQNSSQNAQKVLNHSQEIKKNTRNTQKSLNQGGSEDQQSISKKIYGKNS